MTGPEQAEVWMEAQRRWMDDPLFRARVTVALRVHGRYRRLSGPAAQAAREAACVALVVVERVPIPPDDFDVEAAAAEHHARVRWHDRSLDERAERIRALGLGAPVEVPRPGPPDPDEAAPVDDDDPEEGHPT